MIICKKVHLFVWIFATPPIVKFMCISNYFENITCKMLSHTKFVLSIKTCCRIFQLELTYVNV